MNYSSYVFKTTVQIYDIAKPESAPLSEGSATYTAEDAKEVSISHTAILAAALKKLEAKTQNLT